MDASNALHLAASKGFELVVDILLQHGARADATNKYRWTALHFGSQIGNAAVVEKLIDHQAGIDVQQVDGQTALHLAAKKDSKR